MSGYDPAGVGYFLTIQNRDRRDPPEIKGPYWDYRNAYTAKGRYMQSGYLVRGPFRREP